MTRVRGGIFLGPLVALALTGACVVFAQWQVNPQVGRVNNRVGGELYGGNTGSVRYAPYQTNVLPSEARYATWRSGALPSEVRMQASAVGPLAPSGAVAYVPGPSALQRAAKAPQPPLYNPAYGIQNKPLDAQLQPQAGLGGSIRYANTNTRMDPTSTPIAPAAPSGSQPLPTAQLPTGQLPSGQITGQVNPINLNVGPSTPGARLLAQSPAGVGSIRYESLSKP